MSRLAFGGAVLTTLLGAGYVGALWSASRPNPPPALSVVLAPEGSDALAAHLVAAKPVQLRVDGAPQDESQALPPDLSPGLHTAVWSVSYWGRPDQAVAHSFFYGSRPTAQWVARGAKVYLTQAALDAAVPGESRDAAPGKSRDAAPGKSRDAAQGDSPDAAQGEGRDAAQGRAGAPTDGADRNPSPRQDLASVLAHLAGRFLARDPQAAQLRKYAGSPTSSQVGLRLIPGGIQVRLVTNWKNPEGQHSSLVAATALVPSINGDKLRLKIRGQVRAQLVGQARKAALCQGQTLSKVQRALQGAWQRDLWAVTSCLAALWDEEMFGSEYAQTVREKAAQAAQALLPQLSRLLDAFLNRQLELQLAHPGLVVHWRPAAVWILPDQELAVYLDVALQSAQPDSEKNSSAFSGPPFPGLGLPDPQSSPAAQSRPATQSAPAAQSRPAAEANSAATGLRARSVPQEHWGVELSLGLFNVALRQLWQQKQIAQLARSWRPPRRLSSRQLEQLLAFEVTGISLGEAPAMVRTDAQKTTLGLGPVHLELKQRAPSSRPLPRRVALHGTVHLRPQLDAAACTVNWTARLGQLVPSCGQGSPADPLHPCLVHFSGLARDFLQSRDLWAQKLKLPGAPWALALDRRSGSPATVSLRPQRLELSPGRPGALRVHGVFFLAAGTPWGW